MPCNPPFPTPPCAQLPLGRTLATRGVSWLKMRQHALSTFASRLNVHRLPTNTKSNWTYKSLIGKYLNHSTTNPTHESLAHDQQDIFHPNRQNTYKYQNYLVFLVHEKQLVYSYKQYQDHNFHPIMHH